MSATEERLSRIESKIKAPSFMQNMGLGNEVGYYVFDYPPEDELLVRERVAKLVEKVNSGSYPFSVKEYDLYDIIINLLKAKGYLETCFRFEKKNGFGRITKSLIEMLRLSSGENNLIIKHIKDTLPENTMIFITGVGKCFPILRSHNVLNNLHQIIDNVPVILFYPGKYDGQQLILFGEIKDDNYYRAFPLVD